MIIYLLLLTILGLLLGSFANVCVYRIPAGGSVVRPGSHCCACQTPIAWYDNIPIFSFILLRARCRRCGASISWQYPLVELLTGLSFLMIGIYYPLQPVVPFLLYFAFVMIVISGIDIPHQIIPDVFSLSLIAVGIGASVFNPLLGYVPVERLVNSLIGAAAGAGVLILLGLVGTWMFKKDAMGGGDVKLLAGIGAFIGLPKVLLTLFIASLFGAMVGGYLLLTKKLERRGYIPFGPFLALAGYINLFLPDPRILLYFLWQ